jgi:hypothetical protein
VTCWTRGRLFDADHHIFRHPGPEPGSSRRTSVSRKDSITPGKGVFSREGLRVTGSRLKAGMTERWEGAA